MNHIDFRKFILFLVVGCIVISTVISVVVVKALTGQSITGLLSANGQSAILAQTQNGPLGTREAESTQRPEEPAVAAVERANPAVVSIVATKDVPVIEQYNVNPFGNDPFLRQFFGEDFLVPQFRQRGTQTQEVSSGSGFVVSPDGIILTNKHVVADTAAQYTAVFNDGSKVPLKILARDPRQDFAIVKAEKSNLPFLILGRSSDIKIGQSVIAIGNALGEFRNTVSVGVISGLHRDIVASGAPTGPEELQELIQTDAAINPGNSGGPLLNLVGEVVGINTAMAQGAQSIGFAIPIDTIKRSLRDVEQHGRIMYPLLGVRYIMLTPAIAADKKLAIQEGALVEGSGNEPAVMPGSPAEKAGVKAGDVVVSFAGEKPTIDTPLASIIQKHSVGEEVTFSVWRNGAEIQMQAVLDELK